MDIRTGFRWLSKELKKFAMDAEECSELASVASTVTVAACLCMSVTYEVRIVYYACQVPTRPQPQRYEQGRQLLSNCFSVAPRMTSKTAFDMIPATDTKSGDKAKDPDRSGRLVEDATSTL